MFVNLYAFMTQLAHDIPLHPNDIPSQIRAPWRKALSAPGQE